MTGFGAEQKHVTVPMDFGSPSENGHPRDAYRTARFAPKRPPVAFEPLRRLLPRLRAFGSGGTRCDDQVFISRCS
jgi:hypothetical protein